MDKKYFIIAISLIIVLVFGISVIAEEVLTMTTYYPSPTGIYTELSTRRLGIGDTNGDAEFDADDARNIDGNLLVANKIGVNLGDNDPDVNYRVDVNGVINATGYRVNDVIGASTPQRYMLQSLTPGVPVVYIQVLNGVVTECDNN